VQPAPRSPDDDEDTDSDEDEDEDEDEEEEEEEEEAEVLKPVFVPRAKRQTVAEEAAKLAAEEAAALARASEREGRKKQSRSMVSAAIQRADAALVDNTDVDSDAGLPDDADCQSAAEAEAELRAWRLRELRRVKRDFEARRSIEQEKAELERRRGLTDAERRAEDEAAGRLSAAAARAKPEVGFMQKYHHKGAFYMDDASLSTSAGGQDDVRLRDNHAPTGEDKFNKAALPAVLQVRKFGMKGRTKYTHLLDQDTSAKARPLRPEGAGVEERLLERRAWDIDGAGRASKKPKM
jgi:microfibrillar-associated protein 1